MQYFTIASRITLIGAALYGIYSLCEDLRPQFESNYQYIGTFIFLAVMALWSIIDWNTKATGR